MVDSMDDEGCTRKDRISITISRRTVKKARQAIGLIPLSRWIEYLINDALNKMELKGHQASQDLATQAATDRSGVSHDNSIGH